MAGDIMSDLVQNAADSAAEIISTNGHDRPVGQRFTSCAVARFMAKQIGRLPIQIRLLDPGSGVGILAAAVCERIAKMRTPRSVFIEAWETDPSVLSALTATLVACREILGGCGHALDFKIL